MTPRPAVGRTRSQTTSTPDREVFGYVHYVMGQRQKSTPNRIFFSRDPEPVPQAGATIRILSPMRRRARRPVWAVLAAIVVFSASCGSEGGETATESVAGGSDQTTLSAPEVRSETTAAASQPESSGQQAPEFTLELGEGGTFVLSEQTTPVLIMFWAEW